MGISIVHWIIFLATVLILFVPIYLVPIVKILHKAGYSGWWCLMIFVPVANVVMFWVFAFADWPSLRAAARP